MPVLVSYEYMGADFVRCIEGRRESIELMIDSGAFTAWKAGKVIELDEYCRWLDALPFRADYYYTLDVIGDPEGSHRNYELMRARGYAPVPIVTRGESVEMVDRYFAENELVAFGGVTAVDRSSAKWCRDMMAHVGDRRAHLLGMTRWDLVKALRPWSIDSSSWKRAARFGFMSVYMGHGDLKTVYPQKMGGKVDRQLGGKIRALGYDPHDMFKADAGRGNNSVWQNITTASWLAFSQDLQRELDVKFFFAISTTPFLKLLLRHWDKRQGAA